MDDASVVMKEIEKFFLTSNAGQDFEILIETVVGDISKFLSVFGANLFA